MSALIKELVNNEGTKIYPVTSAEAVYMPNGKDTVQRVLGDMKDQNTEITFPQNQVIKELASGNTVVTQFNNDGTIVETTTNSDDVVLQVKTTTFNSDGSITITIDGEE